MIKKILFTFLLAFVCFFGIDKVFAESKTFTPSGMSWYHHNGSYGDGSPSAYTINGATHYGKQLDINIAKLNFGYRADNFLPLGDYYDLDFVLDVGIGGYTDIIATFDNVVCEVYGTGQIFGSISNDLGVLKTGETYSYVVHCENYYVHTGWSELSIYMPVSVSNFSGSVIFAVNNVIAVNYGSKHYNELGLSKNNSSYEKINDINEKVGATNEKLGEVNESIKDTNKTLNDDDTSESTSEATEFFEGFDTDTHGLTSIITAPLELIGNIAGSTCSPLPLTLPFVNKSFSLPCMDSIYKKHFGSFLTIYQTITFGIVAYWVCVRIFALVKDFKNPEHDEIEVMDL